MLDSLRSFAKSWPGKAMGGVLLVGLASFGINNVITSLGSNTVATVGSQEITTRDFVTAYQNRMNQISQQIGRVLTGAEAESVGLPSEVITQLTQSAAQDQLALNYGIGVSDAKLGLILRDNGNFSGQLGGFDPDIFKQTLKQNGITESDYFETLAKQARRQQVNLALFSDVALSSTAQSLLNGYVGEKRTIDYFTIGETNVDSPAAPTEDELASYLKDHQTDFRTVETRTVQLLALSPQALADTKTIGDDAIAAEYEKTKASLTKPERRTIQQVVLNDAQLAAFTAGKAAGTKFAALATAAGLTSTEVGTFAKPQVTDVALADAAFGLAVGDFAIIDGATGKRAVSVSAIDAGGTPALADVKQDISNALALAQAKTEINDILDQIEELRAAFKPLSEIATRFNLKLYDVALTADGGPLSSVAAIPEADRTKVADAVFKAEEGKLTPAVTLDASTNLWFDLKKIEPARDETLAEVHDMVSEAVTNARLDTAMSDLSAKIVTRLDAGETIADIATSLNTFPSTSFAFNRQGTGVNTGAQDSAIDATVAAEVFNGGPDHHGAVTNQAGERLVFAVTDVTDPDAPLTAAQLQSLNQDLGNGVFAQFMTGVGSDIGGHINQNVLNQALALTVGQ